MRTTFLLLNRMLLIAGVLVALTPCNLCHSSTLSQAKSSHSCCAMHQTSKSGGCHSKSQSPLCKVMDQSSVQGAVSQSVVPVDLGNVVSIQRPFSPFRPVFASVASPVGSPPRSSITLRI